MGPKGQFLAIMDYSLRDEILAWLSSDNGLVVHCAVFVALILGGLGFPIPEDIPLILAGVAASKNIVELKKIFLTCYSGVLIADQLIYAIGYYFGPRLLQAGTRSVFFPSITAERIEELREDLMKRRLLYIFLGRHLFPIRSVTFLTAGALRISFRQFLIADAIAALISVSIVLGIGWYLGEQLTPEVIEHRLDEIGLVILAIFAAIGIYYMLKKNNKIPKEEKPLSAAEAQALVDRLRTDISNDVL